MRYFSLFLLFAGWSLYALGQSVGISQTGASPDPSAMLDVMSTSKGMLVPRMDASERLAISTPANGLMVYDTDSAAFMFYDGSRWALIGGHPARIEDLDADTKVQVEESADEDIIRFDVAGTEQLTLGQNASGDGLLQFTANTNLFIGSAAGASNTSGDFNTFLGQTAGVVNETGHSNVFSGHAAGNANLDGHSNVFLGRSAGLVNQGGANNVFIGRGAGIDNTSGGSNVFLSRNAGFQNETGANNLAIGQAAGYSNTTGSGNIFLGYEAGYNETGSDKLYIDNSNTSDPLIHGDFGSDELIINGTLNVNQAYELPNTDGSNGQVLGTDGAGVVSWMNMASGGGSGSVEIRSVRDDAAMAAMGYCYAGEIKGQVTPTWTDMDHAGPNVPSPRENHAAIWIGDKLLIWGGEDAGGLTNTGGIYDPVTDSWAAMSTTSAPAAREDFTAILAGDKVIIWGGRNGGSFYSVGGVYDIATDTWTATTISGAPAGRRLHTAVWTGTEMIIWGGVNVFNTEFNNGSRYNPTTGTWTAMTTTAAPSVRFDHTAVWTGTEMIIWGGFTDVTTEPIPNGGKYNPATNSWSTMATVSAGRARNGHQAFWTGDKMIVWGGFDFNYFRVPSGSIYDAATDSWSIFGYSFDDETRSKAEWTGCELVVMGESVFGEEVNAAYNLQTGTWTSLPQWNADNRIGPSLTWADGKLYTWGGDNYVSGLTNSGAVLFRPTLYLYLHF